MSFFPFHPLLLSLAVCLSITSHAFSKDYLVRDYGAVGDGRQLDSPAIQMAIHAAHTDGGGRVILTAGTYRSGTISLKNKVTIHLEKDAILLGSAHLADYQRGNWPALILANGLQDIAITGEGVLDGNSSKLVKEFDRIKASGNALEFTPWANPGETIELIGPTGAPMRFNPHELHQQGKLMEFLYGKNNRPYEYVRPQILEIINCQRVNIRGITLRNAACWVETYRNCEDMLIENIKVRSTKYWNNDGIDIVDCRRVKILDCDIDSADDAICLKSDPPGKGCEDIIIQRCKLASRASALKLGTGSHHGFKRIHASDLDIRDTYRSAVAIQSVDGATIEEITVERVKAVHTGNAFAIRLGHRTQSKPPGSIRRIVLRDFDIEVPPLERDYQREIGQPHNLIPSSIVGLPGFPVREVLLENICIRYGGNADRNHAEVRLDQLSTIPENERAYPEFSMWGELPAWALYIRHTAGISLKKSGFSVAARDFRPAIVADDCANLNINDLTISSGGGEPLIAHRNSNDLQVHALKAPEGAKETIRQLPVR